jgi:kynurenine formamidase
MREPSEENARREARRAFHESQGKVILINTDWLTGWGDRQQAILLGEKLHGKRSPK